MANAGVVVEVFLVLAMAVAGTVVADLKYDKLANVSSVKAADKKPEVSPKERMEKWLEDVQTREERDFNEDGKLNKTNRTNQRFGTFSGMQILWRCY